MNFIITNSASGNTITRYFNTLANALVARNHKVILLSGNKPVNPYSPDSNPALLKWATARPTTVADARFLAALIERQRTDCIIGNFSAVNLAILVGRFKRVPVRIAWHHTISDALRLDNHRALKQHLQVRRKALVLRFATRLITFTEAAAEDARRQYHIPDEKLSVVPCFIPDPATGLLDVTRDQNRVLCVGRLHPSKGQDLLIRAAAQVVKEIPSLRFRFIGDGPERENLKRLAEELGIAANCEFFGELSQSEVYRQFATATLSVVTSRREALGLAAVESLACGTPVIASRTGGLPEVVSDDAGVLVKSDDSAELATAILDLMRAPNRLEAMRKAARTRFVEKFSAERVDEQCEFFEGLVEVGRHSVAEESC